MASPGPSLDSIDKGYKCIKRGAPAYTLHEKPAMVIGGQVLSWTNSIPGPKYTYNPDTVRQEAPKFSIAEKQEMVIGGGVPSWTNSIPGPKYTYSIDTVKPRQPVFTMRGRGGSDSSLSRKKPATEPGAIDSKTLEEAVNFTKKKPPSFSISSKPGMICGEPVPSWVKSIPGPKYTYSDDVNKRKPPLFSIGVKLKTEGELMSVRSPGPAAYTGAAIDAKKQSEVDSTKRKSFGTSFGVGPRWGGTAYQMILTGASTRFDKPGRR